MVSNVLECNQSTPLNALFNQEYTSDFNKSVLNLMLTLWMLHFTIDQFHNILIYEN